MGRELHELVAVAVGNETARWSARRASHSTAARSRPHDASASSGTRTAERLSTAAACAGAVLGLLLLVRYGLRSYFLTDYQVEALPAMSALNAGDWSGYLGRLPAYGGAMLLELPFVLWAPWFSEDFAMGSWRALAVPGLGVLAWLAVLAGSEVARGFTGRRAPVLAVLTALLVAGSPVALRAEKLGHPEELLVAGLAVLAVLNAGRGRHVAAGACVGLAAAGKPWALVVLPVVLVAADGPRALGRTMVAAAVAAALLLAVPAQLGAPSTVPSATASTTATGIFKPTSVFWFLGAPNPRWEEVRTASTHQLQEPDPALDYWAQRLEPAQVGRVSHPLIIVAAFALAVSYALRRRRRRRRDGAAHEDLMLLAAAVLWWRCLLDTWNIDYYALGAITALALWEAGRRRPPLLAFAVTVLMVLTQRLVEHPESTPDQQAAVYLAWAVPLGLWLAIRACSPRQRADRYARIRAGLEVHAPTLVSWISPRRTPRAF